MVAEVGFEPHDLRVMSPTSYQAALLRDELHSSRMLIYLTLKSEICQQFLHTFLKFIFFIAFAIFLSIFIAILLLNCLKIVIIALIIKL